MSHFSLTHEQEVVTDGDPSFDHVKIVDRLTREQMVSYLLTEVHPDMRYQFYVTEWDQDPEMDDWGKWENDIIVNQQNADEWLADNLPRGTDDQENSQPTC